jgi:glutamate formiminotransferase/formiminotetrahydrofolate cyclodeaminase
MPKSSAEEKISRAQAIEDATKYATEIPFKVMELAGASMEIIKKMAEIGNPNSISDAGVGALCARSAVIGAYLNVKINARDLTDKDFAAQLISKGNVIVYETQQLETEILKLVNSKI